MLQRFKQRPPIWVRPVCPASNRRENVLYGDEFSLSGHFRVRVVKALEKGRLQPMYAKVREHGAPVQGARLGGKPGMRRTI
jgi:hypothetical protein